MPVTGTVTIENPLGAGIAKWLARRARRGSDPLKTARYVMKIWVDFAFAKIKTEAAGKKEKIRSYLMTNILKRARMNKRKRINKLETEYAGTIAERVARKINYQKILGTETEPGKRGAAYYRVVRNFVNNRVFSAWHHKAGLFPAYKYFRKTPEDRAGPRYQKHPTGTAEGFVKDQLVELIVENFAIARPVFGRPAPVGIEGLVPDAFEASMAEVDALLLKFVTEDMLKEGREYIGDVVEFTHAA